MASWGIPENLSSINFTLRSFKFNCFNFFADSIFDCISAAVDLLDLMVFYMGYLISSLFSPFGFVYFTEQQGPAPIIFQVYLMIKL